MAKCRMEIEEAHKNSTDDLTQAPIFLIALDLPTPGSLGYMKL